MATRSTSPERSVVLEVDGLHWATEKNVVEATLGRRPGVKIGRASCRERVLWYV